MTLKQLAQVKADYEAEIRAAVEANIDINGYLAQFCLSLGTEMCYNHHERGQRLWAFSQALKELEVTDE